MSMRPIFTFIILMAITSCSSPDSSFSSTSLASMEEIKGRDNDGPRQAIYRVRVPSSWIRHDALVDDSVVDSTKALCEFIIRENGQLIRIYIHNFPTETSTQRIPPLAQVARWQRQFTPLFSHLSTTIPQSFSGYTGVLFTGVGLIKEEKTMVLGWALQLSSEHYRALSNPITGITPSQAKQMRADVTIKATGPYTLMEQHKKEISTFARSFELIEEIPAHQ